MMREPTNGAGDYEGDHESGYALVAVLVVVSFLSILALSISHQFRSHARVSALDEERLQLKAVFEAVLVETVIRLTDPNPALAWKVGGMDHAVVAGGTEASVRIFDELGKLDINTAGPALLRDYFASAMGNKLDVDALMDALVDWRDGDVEKRPAGAEAATYRREDRAFLPRNRDFERVSELMWVRGMTQELYGCLAPGLTVHSHRRGVDASVAHPLVRQALKLESVEPSRRAVSAIKGGLGGRAFEIVADVAGKRGTRTFRAIVRITEDRREPFWVLDVGGNVGDIGPQSCPGQDDGGSPAG